MQEPGPPIANGCSIATLPGDGTKPSWPVPLSNGLTSGFALDAVLPRSTPKQTSDTLTAAVHTAPTNGTLLLDPNGLFAYTPNTDYTGTDTFTYTATDTGGATSNPATVTIYIGVNAVPVANPDAVRPWGDVEAEALARAKR